MGLINRPVRAGATAVVGLAITAMTGALATGAIAAPVSSGPHLAAIKGSVSPTTDRIVGHYRSKAMSVEVALTPRDNAGLQRTLSALYTKKSGAYHRWLATGQFDRSYAPTATTRSAVAAYLRGAGLRVERTSSPFLVRAVGSSKRVEAAFHTTLSVYRDPKGVRYYSNSTKVEMPAALVPRVFGVIGLTNSVREHSMVERANNVIRPMGTKSSSSASCEAPYPTTAQLFAAVNSGTPFPFGFGGGPGCNGMTPQQVNSIYDAPHVGPRGEGRGVNTGVFELSAYQESDIDTWAQTFYGPSYTPPLVNVNVDGGPLSPVCPSGDECPPDFNGYAGDIEVDADIEMQLDISPDMSHLIVYNAPNDFTGQTELDEYTAIASANTAASVSSSWAVCENDVTAAYVQAENVIFEQMAAQGQSMFGAEGDTGAFSCIRSDGTTILNVLDPPSQPWVTSVGGTSLESANPGTNPNPSYPSGVETVWNVDDLCSNQAPSAGNDNQGGFFWCAATGAGGGGNSQWWGRPFYQRGPDITNPYTTHGNGTTQCALAATGTPCREDPDVSANADEYTPYAEYCTGSASTPFSVCATITTNAPGWFGIGGTSLSSPLWSGIAADRDSFRGTRTGNFNPLLYRLYDTAPNLYLHDITRQSTNNNGFFPARPGYDLATGIGTPILATLITGSR